MGVKKQVSLWREVGWGIVLGCAAVGGVAVADQCVQIDAYAKVSDYYQRYVEYKQQFDRWQDLYSQTDSEISGISDNVSQTLHNSQNAMLANLKNALGVPDIAGYDFGLAALNAVGPLARADVSSTVGQCWRRQLGTDLASSGLSCGSADLAQLQAASIQPSTGASDASPNTALTVDTTRAVTYGNWPLLDVVRSDLSWVRDHQEYMYPLRYSSDAQAIDASERAKRAMNMERVGAIMAARGLGDIGTPRTKQGVARDEFDARATSMIGRAALVSDALAEYAVVYPQAIELRESIRSIDSDEIDNATEAQRYAMRVQATGVESRLDLLIHESQLRQERLDAVLGMTTIDQTVDQLERGAP